MQMKSSQQGTPVDMAYTFPAMSEEMYEMMLKVRDLPAFFLILYIDETKQLQWWGGMRSEYPKDLLKEGLAILFENGPSAKVAISEEITLPPPMTVDMFNKLCAIRLLPAYFGIIYMDGDNIETWAEMREGFPEKLIKVGIARAVQRFVTGFIEHIKPVVENPQLEKLREIGRRDHGTN